ncbi:MAG: trypsin-like peptidase domain-containing protein [Thermoanaerobaculales bacterium]|jgi:S1-C subfamily serine protease|nr:trypsin-like peptidase domain-containing protein [Thermoanaerobaculales bacterium]
MSRVGVIALALVPGLAVASAPALAGGLADLFERVDPAVVEIATIQQVVGDDGPAKRVRSGGLGSGFLVSDDGLILTAAHVVHLAEDVAVRWLDGEVSAAVIVSSNPGADLALIRADRVPVGVKPLTLADSDRVRVGDEVFVIGAPRSHAHSLSVGHVSARRAPTDLFGGIEPVELLQTDAAINEGNSGGPMFNLDGEVIGVVSHILSRSGGSEGLGFVVTSNMARTEMLERRPFWSGLDGYQLNQSWAAIFNLPQAAGILVENVVAGSPAARIGLRPGLVRAEIDGQRLTVGGDVVLAIQGIPVGAEGFTAKVERAVGELADDDLLELKVLRAGQVISLTMPIGELR